MSEAEFINPEGNTLAEAQEKLVGLLSPEADTDNESDIEDVAVEEEEEVVEETLDSEAEDLEEEIEDEAETLDDEEDLEEEPTEQTYTIKVSGEDVEVGLEELKSGYSRQADYTKKSQVLAEERKAFQQDANAVALERQQYAQLLGALQAQLQAGTEEAPDWERMYEEDPIEATRQERAWRVRNDQKQQKLQAIQLEQQRVGEANAKEQQEQMRQVIAHEVQELPKVIPEWKDETVAAKEREELREYLISQGVKEEELGALVRANHISVLRKAMLFDRGTRKVRKAAKDGRSATVKAGSKASNKKSASRRQKAMRQRLASRGRVEDAASIIETLL